MTTPWSTLGTLTQYIDFTGVLMTGQSWLDFTVISGFLTGQLGASTYVYSADLMYLIASFVASAYIIIMTVNSGVSTVKGFYATFAGASLFANRLLMYEVIVIILWELLALAITYEALSFAYNTWGQLDARLAAASEKSQGLENEFTWEKAIKASTIFFIAALGNVITGFTVGDVADELVAWVAEYEDNVNSEGVDNDTGTRDIAGTAAEQDIYIHMGTTLYGFVALAAIAVGGNLFARQFMANVFDDGFGTNCDLASADAANYSTFQSLASQMKSRATCLAVIDQIFALEDIDGNGLVTRCEDAKFQYAMGSSEEYALKFSSQYTLGAFQHLCTENFAS